MVLGHCEGALSIIFNSGHGDEDPPRDHSVVVLDIEAGEDFEEASLRF